MRLSHEMERPETITFFHALRQQSAVGNAVRLARAVAGITLFTVDLADGCKLRFLERIVHVEIIAVAADLVRKIGFRNVIAPRSACNRRRCVGFRARPSRAQWQQGTRCRRPPGNKLRGHRGTVLQCVCRASSLQRLIFGSVESSPNKCPALKPTVFGPMMLLHRCVSQAFPGKRSSFGSRCVKLFFVVWVYAAISVPVFRVI